MNGSGTDRSESVWCVVANIKHAHPFGEGGVESRIGTRQFRGGTRVYIAGCYPGNCEAVVCIGLHRKTRRFITCVVNVMHLEHFRPRVAYHPEVVRRIRADERCWFRSREDAVEWAAAFLDWQELWSPDSARTRAGGCRPLCDTQLTQLSRTERHGL